MRKRCLRNHMQTLIDIKKDLNHDNAETHMGTVLAIVNDSEIILQKGTVNDRLNDPSELLEDANVLRCVHEIVRDVVEDDWDFNPNMLVEGIDKFVGAGAERDWDKLASVVCLGVKTIRIRSTMLGCVEREIQETVTKERRKRRTQTLAEEKKLAVVESLSQHDDGITKMKLLYNQLKKIIERTATKSVPFYAVITHPTDFMQTVDNTFQMSLMAREKVIAIEKGDDGYPMIMLTTNEDRENANGEDKQSICNLDTKFCEKMINFYKITEPMLQPVNCYLSP